MKITYSAQYMLKVDYNIRLKKKIVLFMTQRMERQQINEK